MEESGDKKDSEEGKAAPPGGSGHRSRKEKLVVRSFSTETDEGLEPRIISHKDYYGGDSTAGKRGVRNRRTVSAPSTSPVSALQLLKEMRKKLQVGDEEEGEGEKQEVKKWDGVSPMSCGTIECSVNDYKMNVVVEIQQSAVNLPTAKRAKYAKHIVFPKASKLLDRGIARSASKPLTSPLPRSRRTLPGLRKPGLNQFANELADKPHDTIMYDSPLKLGTRSFHLTDPYPEKTYDEFRENQLKAAKQRKLTRFKFCDKFSKVWKKPEFCELFDEAEVGDEVDTQTEASEDSFDGVKKEGSEGGCSSEGTTESPKTDEFPEASGAATSLQKKEKTSSEPFTPPPPPPLNPWPYNVEEGNNYPREQRAEDFHQGYAVLHKLMKGGAEKGNEGIAYTLPDMCREAIAQLLKLVVDPYRRVNKEIQNVDDESVESSTEEDEEMEAETVNSQVQKSFKKFLASLRATYKYSEGVEDIKLIQEGNEGGEFAAKFVLGAFISNKRSRSQLTEEELRVFKELNYPEDHFEVFEDDQEIINGWNAMVLNELLAERNERKVVKSMESVLKGDTKENAEESQMEGRTVNVTVLPVVSELTDICPPELSVTTRDFVKMLTKGKENQLRELKTRRLRSGKEVLLKAVKLERFKARTRKFAQAQPRRRRVLVRQDSVSTRSSDSSSRDIPQFVAIHLPKRDAITAPPVKVNPEIGDHQKSSTTALYLRNGKEIPRGDKHNLTRFVGGIAQMYRLLLPKSFGELSSEGGIPPAQEETLSPSKDEYAQRVEANLRRLQAAGGQMDYVGSYNSGTTDASVGFIPEPPNRCRTQSVPRVNLASVYNSLAPSPSVMSEAGTSTASSGATGTMMSLTGMQPPSYNTAVTTTCTFKPIQSYPLTATGAFADHFLSGTRTPPVFSPFSPRRTPSAVPPSPLGSPSRHRYSRKLHATMCPPFDNNHCSNSSHHCSYPRVPGSRFCIHHVDEGATVNFAQCQYSKNSRECGRYVPRDPRLSLQLCELHGVSYANFLFKDATPQKPLEKTSGLLKHLRCNLDRAQGKVMESDGLGGFRVRRDFLDDERDTLNNLSNSDESDDETIVAPLVRTQKANEDSDDDDCGNEVAGKELDFEALRNAGYFTVEECVKLTRHALVKQKANLLNFLSLLKRKHNVAFRRYLYQLVSLESRNVPFTSNPKYISSKQDELTRTQLLNELKTHNARLAMLGHRKRRGHGATLRIRAMNKRQERFETMRQPGAVYDPESEQPQNPLETKEDVKFRIQRSKWFGRPLLCMHGAGTREKCSDRALPLTRFCVKHITQDKNQKLYTPCNFRLGPDADDVCKTSVYSELEKFGCCIHGLPVPPKEPPESENKKPKVEEEVDKLLEEIEMDSDSDASGILGDAEDEESADERLLREMEHLVGDELVDMEHYRETLQEIFRKGLYMTDSEESDDTEEEDQAQDPNLIPPLQPEPLPTGFEEFDYVGDVAPNLV